MHEYSASSEEAILRSLRRITRAIDLHSRWLAKHFGLTIPQLICLRLLADQGDLAPTVLARQMDLSQATVTGIVDRLVKRDLVHRTRSETDRRRVEVHITERGLDLLEASPSALQERFVKALAELPPENQEVIRTVLEQIVRMMGAEEIAASPVLTAGPPNATADEVEAFLHDEEGEES